MGTGYTRNDASNNIANGNVIDAADLDGEFDAIVSAFGTSGHSHDGTSAEGGAITNLGPSQEFKGDGSSLFPKADATYDLGKSTASFNVAYVESINLGGTGITASAAEINYTDGVTSAIQTQLDGKQAADANIVSDANYVATDQNFTDADHTKLNGIATSATNTAAPAISTNGSTPSLASGITAAEVRSLIGAGTSSSNNATHTGEVTGSGALTVASNVIDADNLKVTGNGTTSQFLRSDGDGTFTWATPSNTVYTHPTHPGDDFSIDTGVMSGATVISDLDINITTNSEGHVTDANAAVSTRNITLANLGYTGATNANNSTSNATHTGEVTGSGALTVADNVIDAGNLKVTGNGSTSQFLRSDGDGTFTWATPTDTNTNTTYSADGNYGMTLSGTTFRLENDRRRNTSVEDVWSGNTHDYTHYDNDVGIRWYTANAEEMRLTDAGDLHVDGNVTAYSTTVSDINLKEDIKPITGALDMVDQLGGYTFTYKKDGKKSAGVIAQEVEKVLPSAVSDIDSVFHGEEDKTHKVVQYDQLHGLLIEAIKELKAEIETLKGK